MAGITTRSIKKSMALTGCALLLSTLPLKADERVLTGPEIKQILSGKNVEGNAPGSDNPWAQSFLPSGTTKFRWLGLDSVETGTWFVQKDQYCSIWPPSRNADCYSIVKREKNGKSEIIFRKKGKSDWAAKIID